MQQERKHQDKGNVNKNEDIKKKVSESDDHFFETFTALQWKLENAKLAKLREEGDDSVRRKSSAYELAKKNKAHKLTSTLVSKKETDMLYMECLYTIMHKIGATTQSHTVATTELYDHTRKAFNISPEDHEKLMNKASTEKNDSCSGHMKANSTREKLRKLITVVNENNFSSTLGCPYLAPVSHCRPSHIGARLTWRPSHFGACLTLAPYHSLLFGIHADHLFG
uniref:Uncharacterized protein n=1 Tax=Romanomermis culicivorax TaxID=13658 RepID=A0A915J0S5_ROMCU